MYQWSLRFEITLKCTKLLNTNCMAILSVSDVMYWIKKINIIWILYKLLYTKKMDATTTIWVPHTCFFLFLHKHTFNANKVSFCIFTTIGQNLIILKYGKLHVYCVYSTSSTCRMLFLLCTFLSHKVGHSSLVPDTRQGSFFTS